MAVMVWKINSKGQPVLEEIHFENQSQLTLNDVSRQIPPGAYTTFRTFKKTCALNLENHLNRLEETAKLTGCSFSFERETLLKSIRETLKIANNPESRVRISVEINGQAGQIYLMVEPLVIPPKERYLHGADVLTRRGERKNARAKLSNFINIAHEMRAGIGNEVEEVLLVDDRGNILEGLTSNFFGIDSHMRIRTANQGVLMGITRAIVIDLALNDGLKVEFTPIHTAELTDICETFITSSSRGILPVRKIDEIVIGSGKPGEITRMLMEKFEEKTKGMIKEI